MGMSASQARFLCLTARKTNVEYEGQQINQQRTALSNESSNYYSQLSSLDVPTPPSSADYTKISYIFNDGNIKNTITSLIATKDTAATGIYMLNYVREVPVDAMVVNGASVVSNIGGNYSVGSANLRQAIEEPSSITTQQARTQIAVNVPQNVVDKMSDTEVDNFIIREAQMVSMLQEKYSQKDWMVRYVQNSSTGAYEPIFFSLKELQNADYNEKTTLSLQGIKNYVFGSDYETKEIKNAKAKIEQDSSGRYKKITIYDEDDLGSYTREIDTRTEEELETVRAWEEREPQYIDYVDEVQDPALSSAFMAAAASCYNNALKGNFGCYRHVLAHMLDLTLNEDGVIDKNAYPKKFSSSIGSGDVTVTYNHVHNSAIRSNGMTDDMLPISDAIRDGYIPEGKTRVSTIMASDYTVTETEADKYISDYYLRQGNPTNAQRLLSNYTYDADGNIVKKTLRQKCIDMYRAIGLVNSLGIDYNDVFLPILDSLQTDMATLSLNYREEYIVDHGDWENERPDAADPKIYLQEIYTAEHGTSYDLITTTESDDAAYNDAMNQYFYDKAVYDQMVQEINSKIEIIQVQDKNLELKLKQLDTEENAIQTEIDAVKKVISKNVESSFKTFNA